MTISVIIAIVVAVAALIAAVTQISQVNSLKQRLAAIPEDQSVFDALRRLPRFGDWSASGASSSVG